jgi:hypothetical protein
VSRFREDINEDLLAGSKRNLQVFEMLDFLVKVTQPTYLTGNDPRKNGQKRVEQRSGI